MVSRTNDRSLYSGLGLVPSQGVVQRDERLPRCHYGLPRSSVPIGREIHPDDGTRDEKIKKGEGVNPFTIASILLFVSAGILSFLGGYGIVFCVILCVGMGMAYFIEWIL